MPEMATTAIVPSVQHNSETCSRMCSFVGDRDFIHITPDQQKSATLTLSAVVAILFRRKQREDLVIELGHFILPGWSACLPWFLFQCSGCHELSVDYLHGWEIYLRCQDEDCGSSFRLRGARFYTAAGLPAPPSKKEFRRQRKKIMQRIAEQERSEGAGSRP